MPRAAVPGTLGTQPIKQLLKEAGLTYGAAGRALGVSDAQVTRIVNGQRPPSPRLTARMALLVGRPAEACFSPDALALLSRPRRHPDARPGRLGPQPVRTFMAHLGISDTAAARVLGCSPEYVNRAVNGKSRPSLPAAARLARLVGRAIEDCFTLADVAPPRLGAPRYGLQPLGTLLDASGITPAQAAGALKLSLSFIDDILSGTQRPSFEHAVLLARLARQSVEDCFSGELLDVCDGISPASVGMGTTDKMIRRQWNPAVPGPFGVQPAKRLLFEAEVTHEQAALAVGVPQQSVTAVLNGQERPTIVVAARLARVIGHPIEECFTVDGGAQKLPLPRKKAARYGRQPLRKILDAAGISVSKAARRAGMGQVFFRSILRGESRPSLEQAAVLAHLVARPVEDCFSNEMLGVRLAATGDGW